MSQFGTDVPDQKREDYEFVPKWIKDLENSYEVISLQEGQGKYIINTNSYGVVDFFPKANKVLVRKFNDWHEPGLEWIVDYLINKS